MSYANTAGRPNPLASIGAMGVPAGFGALLVFGLAVTVTQTPKDEPTRGFFVPVTPPVELPPPPEITAKVEPNKTPLTRIDRPAPPPIPTPNITFSRSDPILVGTGVDDGWGSGLEPLEIEIPTPRPTPVFDPVSASPRGNPANWIETSDYRSTWIRRELTGRARFTLQIDASGKVSECTITGSTGHEALDRATCSLIQGRAVFNPAKGSDGKPVAGSYSSSVNWQIPK